ncbi:MAG: F0F1 ATP synthase subunit B [Thermodesulfobacteriota bacterium]
MKKITFTRKQIKVTGVTALLIGVAVATSWAASDGEVHNSWLTIDTWKTLNFAVLAIGLFLLGRKPAKAFFSSRKKEIADELKDLEQKKAEAEKQLAEYQARFNNLDQESRQIIEDYIKQGEEAKKRIIAQAEAQAEKLEDMAKRSIEQEFKTARMKLQKEISALAVDRAEQVIQNAISSEDQEKIVDDYLKKVVA